MARSNYSFQKRQKELARKQKKELKRQSKIAKNEAPLEENEPQAGSGQDDTKAQSDGENP